MDLPSNQKHELSGQNIALRQAGRAEPILAVRISNKEIHSLLHATPTEVSQCSDSFFEERAVPIFNLSRECSFGQENVSPNQKSQRSSEEHWDTVLLGKCPAAIQCLIESNSSILSPKQNNEEEEEEQPYSPAHPIEIENLNRREQREEEEEENVAIPVDFPERKDESETLLNSTSAIQSEEHQQPHSTTASTDRPSIVFTLNNLPFFNMTKIICCFSVSQRLVTLSQISKRIRQSVYQPQCFRDVSFFPIIPDEETGGANRAPKILNVHTPTSSQMIRTGITYVEVCMASAHPFVQKVAKYGGMWNFKAELFNKVDWPTDLSVESLQLSFDPNTDIQVLDLCDGLPETSKAKISNLFLIKFEMDGPQPRIMFPTKLQGVGLQSFTSNAFRAPWWKFQIEEKRVFESIRFLVLSCCDFRDNELQTLLSKKGCAQVEHLSLRYVKWHGVVDIPSSLVSFGFFPDVGHNSYRLANPNSLWQLQTRLSENMEAAINMLNRVHESSPDLRRISFEFIRGESGSRALSLNVDDMRKWGHEDEESAERDERFSSMTIVVDQVQWTDQPRLKEVFMMEESQFVAPIKANFLDCPKWSEDAREFIMMTARRKLLLR